MLDPGERFSEYIRDHIPCWDIYDIDRTISERFSSELVFDVDVLGASMIGGILDVRYSCLIIDMNGDRRDRRALNVRKQPLQ